MDDLISRQELLNDVEELRQSPWFNDDNYFAIRKDALSCVVDLCIKKAPSAQTANAVDVVRCKDCKHYKGMAECECVPECGGTMWFCAWGEREEGDE